MTKHILTLTIISIFLLYLIGCGGGGDGVTTINTNTDTGKPSDYIPGAKGSLEITIDWPEIDAVVASLTDKDLTGQIIPQATDHMKITLYTPATVGDPLTYGPVLLPASPDPYGISTTNPFTIARPTNSIVINNITCGRIMVKIEAQDINNNNLATRRKFITVLPGRTVMDPAKLGVTIENGIFDPKNINILPGEILYWGNYSFTTNYYITFIINGSSVSLFAPHMSPSFPGIGKYVGYTIPETTESQITVSLREGTPDGPVVDTGLLVLNSSGGPGHSFDTATSVTLPYSANHIISTSGFDNFYKFTLSSTSSFHVDMNFTHINGDLDLYLYDSSQSEIGYSMGTTNQEIIEKSLNAGTYYVKVHGYNGATNSYSINMTATGSTVGPYYVYDRQWQTIWDGEVIWPHGIAVDSSGYVYVSASLANDSPKQGIMKFDSSGNFITKWGTGGWGNGEFHLPIGVAVDSSFNVYAADCWNHRIQKFNSNGSFITKWGTEGTSYGQIKWPNGVAIDSSGNVYVTNQGRVAIDKLNSNLEFINSWSTTGTGSGLAIDTSNNYVYFAGDNNTIQQYNASGNRINTWGSQGSGNGQFNWPRGLAILSDYIYIPDVNNNRIQVLNKSGAFINKWGSQGNGNGQFKSPMYLAINRSSGYMYVADEGNGRIQVFRPGSQGNSNGRALNIGLNSVDPAYYGGWSGDLNGCEYDANDMKAIGTSQGFTAETLLTSQATREIVVQKIREAAQNLQSGDIFMLSYSGHGGQWSDTNGDETDGSDETWCLYNGQFVDDELYALWSEFRAGVRIIVFSDSCHSGTVVQNPLDMFDVNRPGLNKDKSTINASIILISGCEDSQTSMDGSYNGLFTGKLKEVWNNGVFTGDYPSFQSQIRQKVLQYNPNQAPAYYFLGQPNPTFEAQKPFTIDF